MSCSLVCEWDVTKSDNSFQALEEDRCSDMVEALPDMHMFNPPMLTQLIKIINQLIKENPQGKEPS